MNFQRNDTEAVLNADETRNLSDSATSVTNLLPTNTCIYIHGTLVSVLFVVAMTR